MPSSRQRLRGEGGLEHRVSDRISVPNTQSLEAGSREDAGRIYRRTTRSITQV